MLSGLYEYLNRQCDINNEKSELVTSLLTSLQAKDESIGLRLLIWIVVDYTKVFYIELNNYLKFRRIENSAWESRIWRWLCGLFA